MERVFRNHVTNRPIIISPSPISPQTFNSFSAAPADKNEVKYKLFYQGNDLLTCLEK